MTKHLRYLFMILLLLTGLSSKAETEFYRVGDLLYEVDNYWNTAKVVHYDTYKSFTEVTIPDSISVNGKNYPVTSLRENCFKKCTRLYNINLPNSITSLGPSCFEGCKSLMSINIPSSVTSLGDYCFSGCTSLYRITIPDSLQELGNGCFSGCTDLNRITIPNSVTLLGSDCFNGCTNLVNINMPNFMTSIGPKCFKSCKRLTRISIPDGVQVLGDECFCGCESLTRITIPSSMSGIRDYGFASCTNLVEVTCLGQDPPYTNNSFSNKEKITLYVPESSLEAYKKSWFEWSKFGKILPLSASGIKAISKDDINVNSDNGTITLSNVPNTVPVSVYSTSGQLLGSGRGNISVSAQGATMVIVKVGGKSYKMLLK